MLRNIGEKISKNFIVSLGVGLLAALIGSFAVISFVLPAEYWGGGNLASQNQDLLKASLGAKAYGRLEVFEFLDKALPSSVEIYKKKPVAAQAADNIYLDKDRQGYGFILTADGWIVSNKTVADGLGAKGLAVAAKGKIYDAQYVVFDTWTDAVFIKINAENLPVISLGESGNLQLGDVVFGGKNKNTFWFTYISAVNSYPESSTKSDLVISSEKFVKIIEARSDFPRELNGGIVANRAGEAVGIIVADAKRNYILPVDYWKSAIAGVLKNKKAARPYLGVNYIDLSAAQGADLPAAQGAYLYGAGAKRAIEAGSPAEKAGLAADDIITAIDGESIDGGTNLAEMISGYKGGQEISIKFLREGKEMETKAVLEAR